MGKSYSKEGDTGETMRLRSLTSDGNCGELNGRTLEQMKPLMEKRHEYERHGSFYAKDPDLHKKVLDQVTNPEGSEHCNKIRNELKMVEKFKIIRDRDTGELVKSLTFGSAQIPRVFINNSRIHDQSAILRRYLLLHDPENEHDTGELLFDLLTEDWKLPHPTMVISLIAGTVEDKTKLNAGMDELHRFCATHSTWILSDGMHNRASLLVAESLSKSENVKLIGFPRWSSLGDDKALLNGPSFYNRYDSCYFIYNEDKLKSADSMDIANPYQDVYLFEDTTDRSTLRDNFVKYLHGRGDDEKLPIFCVSLVIGGNDTEKPVIFKAIAKSLDEKLPVVIVSGSGFLKEEHQKAVSDEERTLLTFVGMGGSHEMHESTIIDGILKTKDHDTCLSAALRADSIDFVNAVFARQGIENSENGHDHIRPTKLGPLYNKTLSRTSSNESKSDNSKSQMKSDRMNRILFDDIETGELELKKISKALFKITEWRYAFKYSAEDMRGSFSSLKSQIWHLFVYAILCNRNIEIVMCLGSLTASPLGAFVFAYFLYRKLSLQATNSADMHLGQTFRNNADHCIRVASEMIEKMYNNLGPNAFVSLKKELPFSLGNRVTALSLAGDSKAKTFIGTTCCSMLIRDIWFAEFPSGIWHHVFALLVPPSVFCFLKFDNKSLSAIFGKVRQFYCAPVTKFILDFAAYLGFLVVFSRFLLSDLQPVNSYSDVNVTEWLIYCFVCAKIVEEARQVYDVPSDQFTDNTLKDLKWYEKLYLKLKLFKFSHYFTSGGMNMLDCAMLTLFLVSVICRFTLPFKYFQLVRILFCCSLILFSARILRFMYVIKQIGPRVIAITLMLNELAKMCLILLVFIVAFGISFQSLLSPGQPVCWNEIGDLLYRPYWQMYGEIFLDDASTEMGREVGNSSCTYLKAHGHPELHCFPAFPYVLLAFYLVVANVLLLNFVIAIFGRTLSDAEDKSKVLWAYEQYVLAREYYFKTWLPVPFNLLWFPFELIIGMCAYLSDLNHKTSCKQDDAFFIPKDDDDIDSLKELQYRIYLQVKAERD